MPLSHTPDLAQALHETNGRLRSSLDRLLPDSGSPTALPRPATSQQMAELLSELRIAGQWLRTVPAEKTPGVERELNEYRKNVERLRELLPSIHQTLLRERDRLEQESARVTAAREWVHRSRQTL
jgi:hypothetical protein